MPNRRREPPERDFRSHLSQSDAPAGYYIRGPRKTEVSRAQTPLRALH